MRFRQLPIIINALICLLIFSNYSWSQEKNNEAILPENLLQKTSVDLKNITFEAALDSISHSENLKLNFNRDRIPVDKIISVKIENERLIDILRYMLDLTGTQLIITSGDQIVIVPSQDDFIPTGHIKGKVIDKENQRSLIGTNILLEGYQIGASTDTTGKYSIENLPVGNYSIRISYIGYQTVIIPDIIVRSDRITFIDTELKEKPILGQQVIISDSYFPLLDEQPTSSSNFSAEEIRRTATLAGDVTRAINGLPSISNENEGNHIIARGGSTIENSFYVDGIEIPNINHFPFPGTTGGSISVLNLDFIRDINVHTGGFSSKYGDKLSSVVDIKYRDGNREEIDMQFNLNIAGISAQSEGPMGDGTGSWMFSARHSFSDIILRLIDEEDQPSVFNDIQGKLVYNLSPNHQISLINIFSNNDWTTPIEYSISNYWNWYGNFKFLQNVFGINWKYLWSDNGYSNTTVSHIIFNSDINLFTTTDRTERLKLNPDENIIQIRNKNFYKFNSAHKVEFGAEAKLIYSNHNDLFASKVDLFGNSVPELKIDKLINTNKIAGFLTYKWIPLTGLKINPGLRLDYFEYNKNLHLSPRFSFIIRINETISFTGSAGVFYQNLPIYFLSQKEVFRELQDPVSYHMILGFNYLFSEDTRLSIELYNKDYKHLPVDPNLPTLYLLDGAVTDIFYTNHENLVSEGIANSRGLEVMLEKKLSNNFYGRISGTVSEHKYRDLDGTWRSRLIDSKFSAAVEGGYKLDEEWEFSLRWSYAGGVPYTPFDVAQSIISQRGVLDISMVNSSRLSNYQNLSFRVDRRFHFSSSNLIIYLSVWNVFDRENISNHGWSENGIIEVDYKLMSRVPIFGIEFEF